MVSPPKVEASRDVFAASSSEGRRYEVVHRLSGVLSPCREPDDLAKILYEELREFLEFLRFYINFYRQNSTEVEWAVVGQEKSLVAGYANVPVQQRPSWQAGIGRTLALFGILVVCCATGAFALNPTSRISQYGHTAWRLQDGYFGGIPAAITQTTDGYIWVGTDAGLFRFDGVRFIRWSAQSGEQLPPSRIASLLGARDGSLWIGTDDGLAHLINNRLTLYEKTQGWLAMSLIEDREGTIWFAGTRPDDETHPLCRVVDLNVRCYGREEGVDAYGGGPLAADNRDNLWIGGDTAIARWRPGASEVYRPQSLRSNQGNEGVTGLVATTDGSLWVGIAVPGRGGGLQHMVNGTLEPFRAPKLNGETLLVQTLYRDRQNSLWVGTSQGLFRIRGADVDHYGSADGLSADYIYGIFEDREGNLWVATAQGIDMFRDLRVRSVSRHEGLNEDAVESLAASQDGSVWIGTSRLQVLRSGGVSFVSERELPGNQVTSLFVDHTGRLWAGMNNKLFVQERGGFRQITKEDGSALGMVMGITEDSEHTIWVESSGPPPTLLRIQDLKVREELPAPETPSSRRIVVDPQRGIWLGLVTGDLARFRDGQIQTFTFGNHANTRVLAITAASDGSILGGSAVGVVGWKNGRTQTLTTQNGLPCNIVTALISDDASNLWLYAQCGLIEISNNQMQLWWEHPESKLNVRVFDTFDGFQSGLGHFNTSAKTPDGRLWFANGSVVQTIDPAHIPANTLPPPVHISGLIADRKAYAPESGIRLPPRTGDLEIDYTALSFGVPQKVLFRYKLEGRDTDWVEAVTRRQAFYNDLLPRHYRFRVVACNNDGVWNEEGATLDFSVAPAWYQTTWFRVLCVGGFVLMLWALYQLRLQQLERHFKKTLEARVGERTRIARELHDTLLQSLHGLMFRFQAARNMLPRRPEQAMQALDGAIARTEQAIAESRGAIQDLRSESLAQSDLAELLTATGQELAAFEDANRDGPVFRVIVEGERRRLSPILQQEVHSIARELLRNAFQHASAHRIEAEIRYEDGLFRLRVRDDGKGMDPKVLEAGGRAGHWGLPGLRERAQKLGVRLDFWSEARAGTEVQLTVPASIAYEKSRDGAGFRLFRKARIHEHQS
jgi:signal transduction histidine kinase/ligand-binding sensor domain-containing protein